MEKIKKGLNSKIVSLVIAFVFSFDSVGYCLRVPMGDRGRYCSGIQAVTHTMPVARTAEEVLSALPDGTQVKVLNSANLFGKNELHTFLQQGLVFYNNGQWFMAAKAFGLPDFLDDPDKFSLTAEEIATFSDSNESFTGGMPIFNRYFLYIQSIINPERKDVTIFVPGGVHRFIQACLLTDAKELVIIDPEKDIEFQHNRIEQVGGKVVSSIEDAIELHKQSGETVVIPRVIIEFEYRGKVRKMIQYLWDAFDLDFSPEELAKGYDVYIETWFRSSSAISGTSNFWNQFNAKVLSGLNLNGFILTDSSGYYMMNSFVESLLNYERIKLPHFYGSGMGNPEYLARKTREVKADTQEYNAISRATFLITTLMYWKDVYNVIDTAEFSIDEKGVSFSKEESREKYKRQIVNELQKIQQSIEKFPAELQEKAISWLREFCYAPINPRKRYGTIGPRVASKLLNVSSINRLFEPIYKEAINEVFPEINQIARNRIIELASSQQTYNNPDNRELYRVTADFLGIKGVVIDVGSGSNNLPAEGLIQAGVDRVIRIDNSNQLQGAGMTGNRIEKRYGDATDLPLNDNSCDAVIHNQDLSFVGEYTHRSEIGKRILANRPDLQKQIERGIIPGELSDLAGRAAIEESLRVLKPGAWILIKPGSHTMAALSDYRDKEGKKLVELLEQIGFIDIVVLTTKTSKMPSGNMSEQDRKDIAEMFSWSEEHATAMFTPIDMPVFIYARKSLLQETQKVDSLLEQRMLVRHNGCDI